MTHKGLLMLVLLFFSLSLSFARGQDFVTVKGNSFAINGKPYYYIGTNFWYGTILAAPNRNRERLIRELDFMKECN